MNRPAIRGLLVALVFLAATTAARGAEILVEAESFASHGGWQLDTQFIATMGSPYLIAHGLGRPVADAATTARVEEIGTYRVWVRTLDWVARWKAPGTPGRFRLLVDGAPLATVFGTRGARWSWKDGGRVRLSKGEVRLALRDETGFDGRCDAIFFTTEESESPPDDSAVLPAWRRRLLGLPEKPATPGPYDLVVVGGGYSGMGAAISAARMGCRVALIQDRPVLGGNGSSEVRVWANGLVRRGRFPRVGEIVEEFTDHAKGSPARAEDFGDALKEKVVRAETKIDLFLSHHAYDARTEGNRITSVLAFDTRTSEREEFRAPLYVDATGHGTIGQLAGADFDMTRRGHMGTSNMWRWAEGEKPVAFPETPWALDLDMKDFPYTRDRRGEWFWESGFDLDPITEAEAIRDWNLRAVFGAFNAMKNRSGAERHRTAYLTWVALIGGPRESRRLLGDVVLSRDDIVSKRDFPDGCVPSTWSIDLHYPKKRYLGKYADNPFISVAEFDRSVDRKFGYPVPYRCFYSRNIANLFMAGRCVSVTHEALGTVRVMRTCGMMGEVVGKAASICLEHSAEPRDVYEKYLEELKELLRLPGKARREAPGAPVHVPSDIPTAAGPFGPMTGIDPAGLEGTVIDDTAAERTGPWHEGQNLQGYIGHNYLYAAAGSSAEIRFTFSPPRAGRYEVRLAYRPHENRASNAPVSISPPGVVAAGRAALHIDMRVPPSLPHGFVSLGEVRLQAEQMCRVTLSAREANGFVHADAVQFLPLKK